LGWGKKTARFIEGGLFFHQFLFVNSFNQCVLQLAQPLIEQDVQPFASDNSVF
jgi:hypothetical protein